MGREHMRFCAPETLEEERALVSARVRQRRDGRQIMAALLGGSALAGSTAALIAHLCGVALQLLLPVVVVLIVIPGAALAITGASSLMWRSRLRRLSRRESHDRSRFRARHRRFLRDRGRLHRRLRPPLGTAS
jgi:hypothetical protein